MLLVACAARVAAPSIAFADGAPQTAEDPKALKRAREQFAQALALQTGGDWASALSLLKEVTAVKSTPQVRFNIALCEEHLGHLVAALGDYELAAADAESEKADQVQNEADARLNSLKPRVPRVVVRRGKNADAASIALDGVALGDSVLNGALPLDPGPHSITAKASGFRDVAQTFRLAEREARTIEITLEANTDMVVAAAPTALTPVSHSSRTRTAGFVVGGVGAVSLLGSGVFFLLRQHAISDLDEACGSARVACPESSRDEVDRGKRYSTLGSVTLIAGAAGVGVGAALIVFGGRASEGSNDIALTPRAAGADLAGASLLGRF